MHEYSAKGKESSANWRKEGRVRVGYGKGRVGGMLGIFCWPLERKKNRFMKKIHEMWDWWSEC